MSNLKILLVEDDPNLGLILEENLEFQKFVVTRKTDGEDAFQSFLNDKFDICLIDVMLPVKDGFTLAKEIRKINTEVPIIFLTAKSLKEDRIEGLKIGADDYITKPFSMQELMLRITAVLKRCQKQVHGNKSQTDLYLIGKYRFHSQKQLLELDDLKQKLTDKESELLKLLCLNMNQTLMRKDALAIIWGDDSFFNARSMDVFITKLRKYLSGDSSVDIRNIHGKGFKLNVNAD